LAGQHPADCRLGAGAPGLSLPIPEAGRRGIAGPRAGPRRGARRGRDGDRDRACGEEALSAAFRRHRALLGPLVRVPLVCSAAGTAPDVVARLRELGRASAAVSTLRAHFVQEKHVTIVREVLRSSGTFWLDKRGRIAWQIAEPEVMRVVIRKDGM